MPVRRIAWYDRDFIRAHKDWYFVFGDNLLRRGYGGQARACRGEPNTIGIPTKYAPSGDEDAFLSDDEYTQIYKIYDSVFGKIDDLLTAGVTIVIPSGGIGTGYARLAEKAPQIYKLLLIKMKPLEDAAVNYNR